MKKDEVIRVEGVSKIYKLYNSKSDRLKEAFSFKGKKRHSEFFALHGINLTVKKGEILGIVGKNGSGKSTLLKIISGVSTPTSGAIDTKGDIVPLLELGAGFNPDYTGLENIKFYSSIIGLSKKSLNEKIDEIVSFAEIGEHINQPLKTYSSGMKARLAFAVSVNINPDILILDEVLSVGDELFKRKSYAKMEEFFNSGKTIIYVSHSLNTVKQICTRAILMDKGELLLDGDPKYVVNEYNKLLFSKDKSYKEVREAIKNSMNNNTMGLEKTQGSRIEDKTENEFARENIKSKMALQHYFADSFISKSSDVLVDESILVSDFRITTPDGKRVNVLLKGMDYHIKYNLTFNKDIHGLVFGASIRTDKSFVLNYLKHPSFSTYNAVNGRKGDTVEVVCELKTTLLPNNYYINTSIRILENEKMKKLMVARDVLLFKVISEDQNETGGFVPALQNFKIS